MTRINCVPVECLTDEHLLAEYKEITRPMNKALIRLENGTFHQVEIPMTYRLGKGHETFFFDKMFWLFKRWREIMNALVRRQYNIDENKFWGIWTTLEDALIGTETWNDWQPTPEDMYLNMARLAKRSKLQTVKEELAL